LRHFLNTTYPSINRRKSRFMARKTVSGKEIIIRCCSCKKFRNDAGQWQDPTTPGMEPQKALFSHSVCPSCLAELYPEFSSLVVRLDL